MSAIRVFLFLCLGSEANVVPQLRSGLLENPRFSTTFLHGRPACSPDPTPVRAWSLEYKAKIKIPHGTFIFACSATRARTWDILLTLIQKFLNGVDYIIIRRNGCKVLRPRYRGLLPEGIVSEPAITCFAIRSFSEGLAADCPRLYVRVSSNSPYFRPKLL